MLPLAGLWAVSLCNALTAAASIASPQSIGSDLAIITHNDLYGNLTSRRAASIILSTPYKYLTATSKCAALGTTLWNPDDYKQDFGYLRYLDFGNATNCTGEYWIKGNSTTQCRTITTEGEVRSRPCDAQLSSLCSNTATDENGQIAVKTNNATVIGQRKKSSASFQFLGIKYASIPARFSQSVYSAPDPGSQISALEYGAKCVQSSCGSASAVPCSEDCLFLNIWTPYLPDRISNKKKAVMVWIHGGGFASGEGSDTTFDGNALASRGDVVAVTINYRLSNLGFLALKDTSLTGNYGLRDQSTALDWLRAHIEDFGGDKDRITVFGQSAGAASVRALLASPEARNKLSRAIMMSTPQGLQYASTFAKYLTITEATSRTAGLADEVGCAKLTGDKLVACLQKVDALKLVSGTTSMYVLFELYSTIAKHISNSLASYPVIDGSFLPTSGLALGPTAPKLPIPILSGIMHDDGSPFTSYPTTTNLTTLLTSQGFPASAIISSPYFPVPPNPNTTLSLFNLTSRIATDGLFRCLAQSTSYTAATNAIFPAVYHYEFDRSYQIKEWSPNPPACEAPRTPARPLGDPDAPYYKCHSGELYAVFGTTIPQGKMPRDDEDIPFSQYVLDSWTAFARTGAPNAEPGFLEARGFVNTTAVVARSGRWEKLGKGEQRIRVLAKNVVDEGFRETGACEVLGLGKGYYDV